MHIPVLPEESLKFLNVKEGGVYVDCTAGGGGHSLLIAKRLGEQGTLICLDRDEDAVNRVKERLEDVRCTVKVVKANYSDIDAVLDKLRISKGVDGIFADLGTSMFQLKEAERGFSFAENGPLDMRMDRSEGKTAADILNSYSISQLERVFKEYGEERHYRRIAKEVVLMRREKKFNNTFDFANLISHLAKGKRKEKIHPATRCFQALRIEVNEELEHLRLFLEKAYNSLKLEGRLVVISFHSLEDRVVKNFFRNMAKNCTCNDSAIRCVCGNNNAKLKILTKKAVFPSEEEVLKNRASRSSRLRAAEKIK
jgi:16S rRNA (cytosine1402-N4)-methyltransferase